MDADHPLAGPLLTELLRKIGQPAMKDDADPTCAICSSTYLTGKTPEFPVTLPCKHTLGSVCILKWLSPLSQEGHNTCPYCRAPIFDDWSAYDFRRPAHDVRNINRRRPAHRAYDDNARNPNYYVPRPSATEEPLSPRDVRGTDPLFIHRRERESAMEDVQELFGHHAYPPANPFRHPAGQGPSNESLTGALPDEHVDNTTYQPYNLQNQTRHNTFRRGDPPRRVRLEHRWGPPRDPTDRIPADVTPNRAQGGSLRERMTARGVEPLAFRVPTPVASNGGVPETLRPVWMGGQGFARERRPRR